MDISRVYRLLRLITLLQSGRGYSVSELAEELQVSRRTVFRDLNMLELAHIPYYHDRQKGGYYLNNRFFLPPVNLSLTEALAILMLTAAQRPSHRLPMTAPAAQAAMKLESALPAPMREHVGSLLKNLQVRFSPSSRHEGLDPMFQDIAGAIVSRRICRMVYISFYEHKQIDVEVHPLRLVFVGRAWYCIAHSPTHRQVRTFKLGRIRKLEVLNGVFERPRGVDPDGHFGRAWSMIPEGRMHNVHLHFEPKVAGNVAEVGGVAELKQEMGMTK